MSKKVIVITGSSSGVGLALANYFATKEYTVFGLSRKIPNGVSFTTIPTDITDNKQVEKAIEIIYKEAKKIDVLINNAGMGMVGPVESSSPELIQKLFQLNLIGVVNLISAVMPIMRKHNSGKIINISSIGSEMGLPFRGFYSASKAALDKITEAFRYEIEEFMVQACVVHLGDIQTNIAENRIHSDVRKAYKSTFEKVYQGMNEHVNDGVTAESFSPFLEKLICKKKLKPHYYYGKFGQKASILLKKILPQLVFEKLIKRYSNL